MLHGSRDIADVYCRARGLAEAGRVIMHKLRWLRYYEAVPQRMSLTLDPSRVTICITDACDAITGIECLAQGQAPCADIVALDGVLGPDGTVQATPALPMLLAPDGKPLPLEAQHTQPRDDATLQQQPLSAAAATAAQQQQQQPAAAQQQPAAAAQEQPAAAQQQLATAAMQRQPQPVAAQQQQPAAATPEQPAATQQQPVAVQQQPAANAVMQEVQPQAATVVKAV